MAKLINSRFVAPSQPNKLENGLDVSFIAVIQDDVQGKFCWMHDQCQVLSRAEFIPYIFQLFAALLEANPSGSLSNYYKNLIPSILTPVLWAPKGNVPALVRLLSSIIARGSSIIAQNGQIETVLGIFQSLTSTKTNETYGFELLESIIANFPP